MKRIILFIAILCSLSASAQTPRVYSIDGIAKRFSTALGIPVKASSFYNTSSDTAIIFFDPSDTTTIHFKYKGVAKKLAASQIPWDSITGKPSNFATTYLLSNDVKDSIQARVRYIDTASLFANRLKISDTSSMLVSRLKISDTAAMLANRLKISDTSQILDKTVRTFGNQSGIIGNKTFTNDLTANSFIKSSGTSDQLLQGDGGVQSKADIHSGAFTFDTTGRLLTIPVLGGGSYSVLIPRGTASGAEGITALTSSRTGNLVTVFGDNGSNTIFSTRDADSASLIRTSDTATMLSNRLKISDTLTMLANRLKISDTAFAFSNYRRTTTKITNSDLANSTISGISLGSNLGSLTNGYGISGSAYNGSGAISWLVDTSAISTKANVTGLLVGYATTGNLALKLNISDTSAMLANRLKISDTATMLLPFMQYSDTANMLSPYARTSNLPDFSAKVNVSDTASMLSNYRRKTTLIENADLRNSAITINGSSTSLGGSISVGTVTSVALSAPTGFTVSGSPITSSGTLGLSFTAGYSLPTTASQALWDIAYNKRLVSAGLSSSQLTLTLGDASTVTASVPTFNQNTTGTAASLSAVLSKTLGGAGDVNGILKANGSGVVSAAVAGTDYVAPSALSGYVDLTTNQTIVGVKTFTSGISSLYGYFTNGGAATPTAANSAQYFSASAGVNNYAGVYYDGSTAYSSFFGRVPIALSGINDGVGYVTIEGTPTLRMLFSKTAINSYVPLSGTSLSMSGAGSFGGDLTIDKNSGVSDALFKIKQSANFTAAGMQIIANNDGGAVYNFISSNTNAGTEHWRIDGGAVNNTMVFKTNSTEAARISSGQRFLIKTTTDNGTDALQVAGSGLFTGALTAGNASAAQNKLGTFNLGFSGAGYPAMGYNIRYTGTSNSYQYDVNDLSWALDFGGGSGNTFRLRYGASGTAGNTISYTDFLTVANTGAATFSSSSYAQGYRFAYSAKSSNYTLTDNDDYITVTNASTVTLPTAVGRAGKRYILRSTAGAGVTSTLATTSSQTVDGAAGPYSFGNGNYNILIVFSDGANWLSEQWITGS